VQSPREIQDQRKRMGGKAEREASIDALVKAQLELLRDKPKTNDDGAE
jgi:hypothetical protein